MGVGESTRSAINSVINTIGSTIVIEEYSEASTDGGYSAEGEVIVSTQTETAIPFEEISRLIKGKFGNLEVGGTQIAIRSDVTIDINRDTGTQYKVTWQEEVYDVVRINRYTIENTLVAYIISVSKRLG